MEETIFNWKEYRAETAKIVLAGLTSNYGQGIGGDLNKLPSIAINLTDKLIEELKK